MTKIVHVVGARPNFMKIAPIMRAVAGFGDKFSQLLVHTGQHYDAQMSHVFFNELGLPQPDVNLSVGSGSHAWQTAQIMQRFEPVALKHKPDWVVVVGDVNSTLACALVCAKLGIPVAHVEAGLRSFDRTMPEEINRLLTDQLADLLFITEESARTNLVREGIALEKIHFVGNVMIDTLVQLLPKAQARPILADLQLLDKAGLPKPYVLVTLHRPGNVDDPSSLQIIAAALSDIAVETELLFPVHPRTRQRLESSGLTQLMTGCRLLEPLGYLDFLALQQHATLVVTDSGGIQEETTYLGIPCLTVRPNTERPVTITHGTNRLVACDRQEIVQMTRQLLNHNLSYPKTPPPLWDGRAAERIAKILLAAGRLKSYETVENMS